MARKITILFLTAITGFMVVRSLDEKRFSFWDFGDAQTLLAATVFRDEGFRATSFLWVPQPSNPVSKFLDDKAVSHHAHGTGGDPQFSGLGPRRMYTHWPSWYSVPYGFFAKLGIFNKSFYQIWASLLSAASLLFLFLWVRDIAGEKIAAVTTIFYGLTPGFLCFSDSLATMPYDDFFRFAFLWRWSARHQAKSVWGRLIGPSLLYLGGFLTSLDSFAFVPIAAVGIDWVLKRKIFWKDTIVLCGFGAMALGIQFLQNVSYLGFNGAMRDWVGYYWANGGLKHSERAILVLSLWVRSFNFTVYPLVASVLAIFLSAYYFRRDLVGWLAILAVAGMGFGILVPGKVPMEYEVRQLLPFVALGTAVALHALQCLLVRFAEQRSIPLSTAHVFVLYLVVGGIALGNQFAYHPQKVVDYFDYPAISHIGQQKKEFVDLLKREIPGHRVYFQIGGVLSARKYVRPGYGQINPVHEYYADALILTVPDFASMVEDLDYFWSKTTDFQPVLLVRTSTESIQPTARELEIQTNRWNLGRRLVVGDFSAYLLHRVGVGEPRLAQP